MNYLLYKTDLKDKCTCCLDDGRKSKKSFVYLFIITITTYIYLHISGVILQNLDWLQLKLDFVSGTAPISTEFSSGLKSPPVSNETAAAA
jgi:hypothetical protein